jgi:hypothetical protein
MPSSQPDNETPEERVPDSRLSDWKNAISRAMRGDFGPPGDSLRNDIMDELADHLSESMKREERAGRGEAEARERVLKRFGSPSQIAARLWFDGMKGNIMFQRWMMGISAAALLLAFVAIGLAFWMVEENNRVLMSAVEKLTPDRSEPPATTDWVTLRFKCIDNDTGAPIENAFVSLSGQLISSAKDQLTAKTDKDGYASLGPLRFGEHSLQVVPNDLWTSNGKLKVSPNASNEVVIRCPVKLPESVPVRMHLPTNARNSQIAALVSPKMYRIIGEQVFDSTMETGSYLVTGDGKNLLIRDRKPDSKLMINEVGIMLPAGNYRLDVEYLKRVGGWKVGQEFSQTGQTFYSNTASRRLHLTASPGQTNDWVVTSTDEVPESLRQNVAATSVGPNIEDSNSPTNQSFKAATKSR